MGAIILDPLGGGSESNTTFSDSSSIGIDGTGAGVSNNVSPSQDFDVTGSVGNPLAFNTDFDFILLGMSSVDDGAGVDFGAELADGGIDRAGDGDLGIRGGSGNGLDTLEGFLLGLDMTNLDTALAMQIVGIEIQFVDNGESGTIVNRNDTSKSLTFGRNVPGVDVAISSNSEIVIDVSSLDLTVSGGSVDAEIASIFVNSGGMRVTAFELAVVPEPSTCVLISMAVAGVAFRRRRA